METDEFLQSTEESLKKKYEIIEKISEGQFGTVFRAINKENSKDLFEILKLQTKLLLLKSFMSAPRAIQLPGKTYLEK
jgi:hypothetical protein